MASIEKILDDLQFNIIDANTAAKYLSDSKNKKIVNYFINRDKITTEPISESELPQLNAIVQIAQIIETSGGISPLSDDDYDTLQEMLINEGIPRLTGSVEINDNKKESHSYQQLRGTLDKVYYLRDSEKRTNRSRKYLSEWIKRISSKYEKATGKKINLNECKVIVTPKFDGASAIVEISEDNKFLWLSRGDTKNNRASNVSHILSRFNDLYVDTPNHGIKFEVMISEENKDYINQVYRDKYYRNSRQIVTAILNSNDPDFKAEYLYPVPLRIIKQGDKIETIHPDLIKKFPSLACSLSDIDRIYEFAMSHRYIELNKMRFRTDGAVITLTDPILQEILGRDDDINNFEVAYKFTEESAYTKVVGVEFYTSVFGFITPVLVVESVILKGNTIDHISLSNKERFDELDLHYGDMVKVLYDIIPYVTIDDQCIRSRGKRIEFIENCPRCGSALDLNVVQVQCSNKECPSKVIGRILNYCDNLRIRNIGSQTIEALYNNGFLDNGIRSLYKLKKHNLDIEELDGFGRLKTRKIIAEIESKRKLRDYEFFGAIGIESLSTKTFKSIFSNIKYSKFDQMIFTKEFDELENSLKRITGIGDAKAKVLVDYLKDPVTRKELPKLLKEIIIQETYGNNNSSKGKIVFSGIRPDETNELLITNKGWEVSDAWNNKASYLVIPHAGYESTKVEKAKSAGVPIIPIGDGNSLMKILEKNIPNLK
jgi:NAD-dependent DNA ligase